MRKLCFFIFLTVLFRSVPVCACAYNVRDVGYVDLGIQPYIFYGFVSDKTPEATISTFTNLSDATLLDTGVWAEVVNIDQQKDHPALKYLAPNLNLDSGSDPGSDPGPKKRISLPAAVLVSPDGRSLFIPVTQPGRPFRQTLLDALDNIVSSPLRKQLVKQLPKSFAVVVLIDGPQEQDNKAARQVATESIGVITEQMSFMPKPIFHPPAMMEVDSKSIADEKILLWSLGLDIDKDPNTITVAVLYGRAKRIGPLLRGEQVNEYNLTTILSIVGADCECGLDRSWILGMPTPIKWDEQAQNIVAKNLGFDPENPMIKMEVSRIIRIGSLYSRGLQAPSSSLPDMPFGYQELVVEFDDTPEQEPDIQSTIPSATEQITPEPAAPESVALKQMAPKQIIPESVAVKPAADLAPSPEVDSPLARVVFILIGLAILVLIAGVIILLRTTKR
ncbi:MAG: hypothetical protein KAT56_08665 [Sedimentisphaerales bacterium]|nr:hypothetical protein [Sedimentisphaerales bacterium]